MTEVNPFDGHWNDEELDSIGDEIINLTDASVSGFGWKMEVHAVDKVGKTFFGMSASSLDENNPKLSPGLRYLLREKFIPSGSPVFVIDTERKAKKLKHHPAFRNKDIKIWEIFFPDPNHKYQIDPIKSLTKLYKILLYIEKNYDHGTIIIDSGTHVTDWIRKYIQYELVGRGAEGHELGELIRMQPSDWMVRDDIWSWLLPYLQGLKQHVIITAKEKEELLFEPDPDRPGKVKIKKSGNFKPRRFKDIPFGVDIEFRLQYNYTDDGYRAGRVGRVISSQYDDDATEVREEDLTDDNIPLRQREILNPTFVKLAEMIYPISHGYLVPEEAEE